MEKQKTVQNLHTGHRERMREKIKNGHIRSFADHELLETLLFNVIKQGDTNGIAHEFIKTFGNVKNVLSCDKFKLMSVKGVGEKVATFIENLGELYRRASLCESKLLKIDNPANIKSFIRSTFAFENTEKIIMVCADKNLKVLQIITLAQGDSAAAKFSVNDAVKSALLASAKFVLISHNHIGSSPQPSVEDMRATKELIKKFALNNIILLDHIITNTEEEFSFRDLDVFYSWFGEININLKDIFEKNNIKDFKMNCSTDHQRILEYLYLNETKKK